MLAARGLLGLSLSVVIAVGYAPNALQAAEAQPAVAEHVTRVASVGGPVPVGLLHDVPTGIDTEMVGFDWHGSSQGEIRLRALTSTGWSDWQTLDSDPALAPDIGSKEFHGRSTAGPVWVGHRIRRVQFQVTKGQLVNLRMDAIHSEETALSVIAPVSSAGVSQPPISSRAQWGADESWRTYAPGCDGSVSYADNVHFLIVHHTVTGNNYAPGDSAAIIRGIYYFHTHTNLWCDIGYNFIVDQYGQIFEGRYGGITNPVIGAQAGGFNTGSSGIALLGTFSSVAPSAAMFSALRRLAGWESTIHGINPSGRVTVRAGSFQEARWPVGTEVTLPTVIGHRDVDFTDCPGAAAYADLPALRADVTMDVGTAWHRSWSGFRAQGALPAPATVGAPAVSSWGVNRFDEFVRGNDNQLYHQWSVDGGAALSARERLGAPPGGLTASPVAVSWGSDRIDIFVRGGNNGLWHKWWANGRWSGWENLGGALTSAPAVASWGLGRLDVFADGAGHVLYHKWYQGGWSGWESLGGVGAFDPGATSWAPGRIDLFTVGTDGHLWHKYYAGVWAGWINEIPETFKFGVGAASWGPGRLDVFAASTVPGTPLTHAFYNSGWYVESLGGSLASAPAAVSWLYNRVDVFVRGNDGGVWHNFYPGS